MLGNDAPAFHVSNHLSLHFGVTPFLNVQAQTRSILRYSYFAQFVEVGLGIPGGYKLTF